MGRGLEMWFEPSVITLASKELGTEVRVDSFVSNLVPDDEPIKRH